MNDKNNKAENVALEPNVIQALLKLKKVSQVEIALERDVSEAAVARVIRRESTSQAIEELIARRLGLPYESIWGSKPKQQAA